MNVIASITIAANREFYGGPLPRYEAELEATTATYPPLFGKASYGERFRRLSTDPSWLASSLASNCAKEAEGAKRLWDMVGRTEDVRLRDLLRRHAVDEARHARYYIAMLRIALPSYLSPRSYKELRALVPEYSLSSPVPDGPERTPPDALLDELIQMNAGEIRTRVHQLLLRPILTAYCHEPQRERLENIIEAIISDETRHVLYTSELIDEAIASGEGRWVSKIMRLRWEQFNELTAAELESDAFE